MDNIAVKGYDFDCVRTLTFTSRTAYLDLFPSGVLDKIPIVTLYVAVRNLVGIFIVVSDPTAMTLVTKQQRREGEPRHLPDFSTPLPLLAKLVRHLFVLPHVVKLAVSHCSPLLHQTHALELGRKLFLRVEIHESGVLPALRWDNSADSVAHSSRLYAAKKGSAHGVSEC